MSINGASKLQNAPVERDAPFPQSAPSEFSLLTKGGRGQAGTTSTPTKRPRAQSGETSEPCKRRQIHDAGQRKPDDDGHCVDVSGTPTSQQSPTKTARPAKVTNVWCEACTILKQKPSETGRKRNNAKHHCPDCAKAREEAGITHGKSQTGTPATPKRPRTQAAKQAGPKPRDSRTLPEMMSLSQAALQKALPSIYQSKNGGEATKSTSSKSWTLAVPKKQQQPKFCDFEPDTDSDDPDNLPKPTVAKHPLGVNGNPGHHSESTRQILKVQPPATAGPSADFFDDDGRPKRFGEPAAPSVPHQTGVSPWTKQAQGTPVSTPYPAQLVMDPHQVAAETAEPSQFETPFQEAGNPSQMLPQPVGAPGGPSDAQGGTHFLGAAFSQPPAPAMTASLPIDPALMAALREQDPNPPPTLDPEFMAALLELGPPWTWPIDRALLVRLLGYDPTLSWPIDPALVTGFLEPAPAPTTGDNDNDDSFYEFIKCPDEREPENATPGSHGA